MDDYKKISSYLIISCKHNRTPHSLLLSLRLLSLPCLLLLACDTMPAAVAMPAVGGLPAVDGMPAVAEVSAGCY